MILLLLATVASDPNALMSAARSRLTATCEDAACAPQTPRSRFRIDDDEASAATAKDRAIGDDGSKCNVVGARRCTKRGRTIFRTDFAD